MNPFIQKIIDHLRFFTDNPYEATLLVAVSIILTSIVLKFIFKERISTLDERVKLRDDQIEYYKKINIELEKKIQELKRQAKLESQPESHGVENAPTGDIRQNILNIIRTREKQTGRAAAMETIKSISPPFEFGVVISELIRMNKEGILFWDNAPNPPEHWMVFTLNMP